MPASNGSSSVADLVRYLTSGVIMMAMLFLGSILYIRLFRFQEDA